MSELSIPERVAAGAAWLDEHQPGWVERIDLDALEMRDCMSCILGQLFGGYWEAPLVPVKPASSEEMDDYDNIAGPLGFQWLFYSQELPDVGAEWRRLIESRRAAVNA